MEKTGDAAHLLFFCANGFLTYAFGLYYSFHQQQPNTCICLLNCDIMTQRLLFEVTK